VASEPEEPRPVPWMGGRRRGSRCRRRSRSGWGRGGVAARLARKSERMRARGEREEEAAAYRLVLGAMAHGAEILATSAPTQRLR
jgi:hypothetical protein